MPEAYTSDNRVRASQIRSDDAGSSNECELCESETRTSVEYGIRVCPSCERTYLP